MPAPMMAIRLLNDDAQKKIILNGAKRSGSGVLRSEESRSEKFVITLTRSFTSLVQDDRYMKSKQKKDKHLGEAFEEVFKGKKAPPSFYARVYEIVEQIPRGKVTTYGAIAEVLGMKRSSRMVGQALSALSKDSDIPAQRVINRIGALSAAHHFGGYERLRLILRKEGVTFKGELVDMEKHFWDPSKSISKSLG
jgi:methylated-DNA-protein-cysteine methyltransferase-like protein